MSLSSDAPLVSSVTLLIFDSTLSFVLLTKDNEEKKWGPCRGDLHSDELPYDGFIRIAKQTFGCEFVTALECGSRGVVSYQRSRGRFVAICKRFVPDQKSQWFPYYQLPRTAWQFSQLFYTILNGMAARGAPDTPVTAAAAASAAAAGLSIPSGYAIVEASPNRIQGRPIRAITTSDTPEDDRRSSSSSCSPSPPPKEETKVDKPIAGKGKAQKAKAGKGKAQKANAEKVNAEKANAENANAEKANAERANAEKGKTPKAKAEKGKAQKVNAEKAKAEKGKAQKMAAKAGTREKSLANNDYRAAAPDSRVDNNNVDGDGGDENYVADDGANIDYDNGIAAPNRETELANVCAVHLSIHRAMKRTKGLPDLRSREEHKATKVTKVGKQCEDTRVTPGVGKGGPRAKKMQPSTWRTLTGRVCATDYKSDSVLLAYTVDRTDFKVSIHREKFPNQSLPVLGALVRFSAKMIGGQVAADDLISLMVEHVFLSIPATARRANDRDKSKNLSRRRQEQMDPILAKNAKLVKQAYARAHRHDHDDDDGDGYADDQDASLLYVPRRPNRPAKNASGGYEDYDDDDGGDRRRYKAYDSRVKLIPGRDY